MQEENQINYHGVSSSFSQRMVVKNAGYQRHQGEQFQIAVGPGLKSLRR